MKSAKISFSDEYCFSRVKLCLNLEQRLIFDSGFLCGYLFKKIPHCRERVCFSTENGIDAIQIIEL